MITCLAVAFFLLYQNIPHCPDAQSFSPIVVQVSTRVIVIKVSCSTKTQSGVTIIAIGLIVTKDTDSCFGAVTGDTLCVEPFLFTV